ncbi:unnamed protein product, partial [Musa acuminata subsp. burmannicoides]
KTCAIQIKKGWEPSPSIKLHRILALPPLEGFADLLPGFTSDATMFLPRPLPRPPTSSWLPTPP